MKEKNEKKGNCILKRKKEKEIIEEKVKDTYIKKGKELEREKDKHVRKLNKTLPDIYQAQKREAG